MVKCLKMLISVFVIFATIATLSFIGYLEYKNKLYCIDSTVSASVKYKEYDPISLKVCAHDLLEVPKKVLTITSTTKQVETTYTTATTTTTQAEVLEFNYVESFPDGNEGSISVNKDLQKYLYDTSVEFNVPYELVISVCYMESRFQSNVDNSGTNSDGTTDYGLMGLNSKYLDYYKTTYNSGKDFDPYNAWDNAYIGIQILADHYKTFNGSVYDTVCAYNLGADGWKNKKSSEGSWYYGDKVLEYLDELNTQ